MLLGHAAIPRSVVEGVVLGLALALQYFALPILPVYRVLQWPEELMKVMDIAPKLMESIEQGAFVPSFETWQAGAGEIV
jgi:hypothetical protein